MLSRVRKKCISHYQWYQTPVKSKDQIFKSRVRARHGSPHLQLSALDTLEAEAGRPQMHDQTSDYIGEP